MFDIFNSENASRSATDSSTNYHSDSDRVFVISAGGSVFIGEKPMTEKIISFTETINRLKDRGNKFVVVVGGGKTARLYQEAAKDLDATNFDLDTIGIKTTQLNAFLVSLKINDSSLVNSFEDAIKEFENGKIPVLGGLSEGQTTDAIGALLAEKLEGIFINVSNVDGIFDKDPNEFDDAHFFEKLSFNDMNFLLREKELLPGQNLFVDKQAASILTRSKIKSVFLNGNHLENFENFVSGNLFKGTVVEDIEDVIEKEEVKKTEEKENDVDNLDKENSDSNNEINPNEINFG
jgi:uridylate kinase